MKNASMIGDEHEVGEQRNGRAEKRGGEQRECTELPAKPPQASPMAGDRVRQQRRHHAERRENLDTLAERSAAVDDSGEQRDADGRDRGQRDRAATRLMVRTGSRRPRSFG